MQDTASVRPKVYDDITQTIGGTPLVRLRRVTEGCKATVVAKLENFNPLWSVKDRIGVAMIEAAEQRRQDHEGHGHHRADQRQHRHRPGVRLRRQGLQADRHHAREHVARAAAAAEGVRGRAAPDARREGHERGDRPGRGAVPRATAASRRRSCRSSSRTRPTRRSTARPPPRRSGRRPAGKFDILVSGRRHRRHDHRRGEVIKARKPAFKCVAVEPTASPVITQHIKEGVPADQVKPGPHKIQGIGAGFIPGVLDSLDEQGRLLIDEVIQVTDDESFEMARRLAKEEGMLCGISCGAAAAAAVQVAQRPGERRQDDRRRAARPRRALPLDGAVPAGVSASQAHPWPSGGLRPLPSRSAAARRRGPAPRAPRRRPPPRAGSTGG